jgi:hypothetical protein
MMTERETTSEPIANVQSQSLIDSFNQLRDETGIMMSVMINYFKDGTIEYNIEHDKDHYGDALPLTQVIGLIYHATEIIIQNSKEADGAATEMG